MSQYVGLDVSLKETSVCVLDGSGRVLWRGTCKATPEAMAATIRKRAPRWSGPCWKAARCRPGTGTG